MIDGRGQEGPFPIEGQARSRVLVARLTRGHEVLTPVLDPLDGRRDHPRRQHEAHLLTQDEGLLPEPAAGVAHDDPDALLGHAEETGAELPDLVGHLGRRPDRHLAARARPLHDESARLHRHRRVRVLTNRLGDDVRCRGERRFDVAGRRPGHLADDVSGHGLVDGDLTAVRRGVVDDGRQRLEVDHHQVGCVLGDVAALGDDERDGVAREADFVLGQRRTRHLRDVRADRGVPLLPGTRVQVGADEHGVHAGQVLRLADVDGLDTGAREGAADEAGMEHARTGDVVDECARAGEESVVLHPADAGTGVAPGAGWYDGDVGAVTAALPSRRPVLASQARQGSDTI